jgi:hypothetical protein
MLTGFAGFRATWRIGEGTGRADQEECLPGTASIRLQAVTHLQMPLQHLPFFLVLRWSRRTLPTGGRHWRSRSPLAPGQPQPRSHPSPLFRSFLRDEMESDDQEPPNGRTVHEPVVGIPQTTALFTPSQDAMMICDSTACNGALVRISSIGFAVPETGSPSATTAAAAIRGQRHERPRPRQYGVADDRNPPTACRGARPACGERFMTWRAIVTEASSTRQSKIS